MNNFELPWMMSILNINGSAFFALIVALIGLITSLFLIIGWRTKISLFVTWVVIMSFHARFPLVNHGGDNLLRMILFWSFFLPINSYYSVDSVLSDTPKIRPAYFGLASIAWIMQVLFVYLFTFLYKWDPGWYKNFDSLYYAMNLDMFTTSLGKKLLFFPSLMKFLSFFAFALEGVGPILLLIPWKISFWRSLTVFLFFALHIGIWMTLELGNFAPACMILWVALIPSIFWESKFFKNNLQIKSTLYYDPDCGFCRKFCFLIKEFLFLSDLTILSGDSDINILKHIQEKKSWVLVNDQNVFIRGRVFYELLQQSDFFLLRGIGQLTKKIPLDYLYNFTSQKRKILGIMINEVGAEKVYAEEGILKKSFITFFILIIFAWNVEGITNSKYFTVGTPWREIVFGLQLNQQWNMFAPTPMKDDGWFVTEANLEGGIKWDILNNKPINFNKQENVQETFPSSQWRKFLVNLRIDHNDTYKLWFGRYLCRRWNETHSKSLDLLKYTLYFVRETTSFPGTSLPVPVNEVVWNHSCR